MLKVKGTWRITEEDIGKNIFSLASEAVKIEANIAGTNLRQCVCGIASAIFVLDDKDNISCANCGFSTKVRKID